MIDKQQIVVDLLNERLPQAKVGIIVKGVDSIDADKIIASVAESTGQYIYAATVGYPLADTGEKNKYILSDSIEKAVLWRSMPERAGHIVVFISNDTDKLHSLAEFDVVSVRDLSQHLIGAQIKNDNNTPAHNFWTALSDASDYFSFEAISDFVAAVGETNEQSAAIPVNMWRLNLLSDPDILSTKNKPEDRLRRNRELIIAIGQLSEDSRKKLSRSLARTKPKDKNRLQTAYRALQNFYKYAQKSTLQELDFSTVQELFSASQKKEQPKKPKVNPDNPPIEELDVAPNPIAPIRPKELDTLISDAVVFGGEDDFENIKELLAALRKHYDTENDENEGDLPLIGGIFGDRPIVLENNQTDLRKLVGRVCNDETWGALIETEETVLKDAISADIKEQYSFNPKDEESLVAFKGGIDGGQALFDFLTQFDSQFAEKQIETAEPFLPIIKELTEYRNALCCELDMIMYHPVLLFGSDEESRNLLINYIQAWEKLYHAFNVNEPTMRQISTGGTGYVARALLLLDVLYIKTPKEWKAILLPLHPIYLWRYYEVFRSLPGKKATLSNEDNDSLWDYT